MGFFAKLLARQERETETVPLVHAAPRRAMEPAAVDHGPLPPSPEPVAALPPAEELVEEELDALDLDAAPEFGALDDFFEAAVVTEAENDADAAPQVVMSGEGAAELRATFGGVAARHLLPVRQFHQRLREGAVSLDWVGLCRPAVATVGRTAVEMNLVELVRPLDQLAALLSAAERQGGQEIAGAMRDNLVAACDELVTLFPEAFAGEDDSDARDSLIVHAVLRQVPRLGTVSLDKIFAAGFTAMPMLAQASAEDLAITTGIALPLAGPVRGAVDGYLEETAGLREDGSPIDVLEQLRAAAVELERHHEAYRAAPETAQGLQQRKGHRQARRLALLRVYAYLATLGEAALVEEMQRLPVDRALERLQRFLSAFSRPDSGARPGAPATGAK